MRLTDGTSDAIELIGNIKEEMNKLRAHLAELEYLVYECDDRVKIEFFDERGKYDTERSKEGA